MNVKYKTALFTIQSGYFFNGTVMPIFIDKI